MNKQDVLNIIDTKIKLIENKEKNINKVLSKSTFEIESKMLLDERRIYAANKDMLNEIKEKILSL